MPSRAVAVPPDIVVHSLAEATAALAAAAAARRRVRLRSGGYLGWDLFRALAAAAGAAVPQARFEALFDPAGQGGFAADALRRGARLVAFPARHPQRPALAALARATGGRLVPNGKPALDLAGLADPGAAVAALLARPLLARPPLARRRPLHGAPRSG